MNPPNRRRFVATAAASVMSVACPRVITASRTRAKPVILGKHEHQYEFLHQWAQLPDAYSWQTTHNLAVDAEGLIYVIHEGREDQPEHPSIFVFDGEGRLVRAFGNQFQGGGHGIEVRQEGSEQFLYVAAYQQVKTIAKLTLKGERIWERYAPMQSGVYAVNEDTDRNKTWGRDRFMPTNFAFLPFDATHQGDFFLADGYGSFYIHRYDKDGNWKSHFGGPGEGNGTFNTPHGLWIDQRQDSPLLVVTDRAHNQLQVLDLQGQHLQTIEGFGLPANLDTRHDLMLVPELLGRVSLVDKSWRPIAELGNDRERIQADQKFTIRQDPTRWIDEKFIHPHDACFDAEGNILVAEWVAGGRVSKLRKLT